MDANQPYELFWRLTFREIRVIIDGVVMQREREHNNRAWLVWHIEAFARSKKLPKLKEITIQGAARQKRRQTADEQISIARQWAVATARPRAKARPATASKDIRSSQ